MLYAVIFEDDTEADPQIRPRHMEAHLAFLAASGSIRDAGPLLDGGDAVGGLWLVEADSAEAVEALVEADPFRHTGLRKGIRVMAWRRVFADGARA